MKIFGSAFALSYVRQLRRRGAVSIPNCLDFYERQGLLKELEQYEIEDRSGDVGPYNVKQAFKAFAKFPEGSLFLHTRTKLELLLRERFAVAERAGGFQLFREPLTFNEVIAQTYEPCEVGISPHKDGKSRINLIAILVLEGHGRFCLCDDRAGSNPCAIENKPGDLVLMRAPGFAGSLEQPFHFLDRITSKRTTMGLRQKI